MSDGMNRLGKPEKADTRYVTFSRERQREISVREHGCARGRIDEPGHFRIRRITNRDERMPCVHAGDEYGKEDGSIADHRDDGGPFVETEVDQCATNQ